jgi:hypothetical protein
VSVVVVKRQLQDVPPYGLLLVLRLPADALLAVRVVEVRAVLVLRLSHVLAHHCSWGRQRRHATPRVLSVAHYNVHIVLVIIIVIVIHIIVFFLCLQPRAAL